MANSNVSMDDDFPEEYKKQIGFFYRFINFLAYYVPGGFTWRPRLHRLRGVNIGKGVWIGQFVYIDSVAPRAVTIMDNCIIGLRSSILTHIFGEYSGKVIIEKNVFIGPHCVILPNVRIGEGSVIRAGTVVSKNVPPHVLWGAPSAGPIAEVTKPLVRDEVTYQEFIQGIRPLKNKR